MSNLITFKKIKDIDKEEIPRLNIATKILPYMGKTVEIEDLDIIFTSLRETWIDVHLKIPSLIFQKHKNILTETVSTNWIEHCDISITDKLSKIKDNDQDINNNFYKSKPKDVFNTEILVVMKGHTFFGVSKEEFDSLEESIGQIGIHYPIDIRKDIAGKTRVIGFDFSDDKYIVHVPILDNMGIEYRGIKEIDLSENPAMTKIDWISYFCDVIDPINDSEVEEYILKLKRSEKTIIDKENNSMKTSGRKILFTIKDAKDFNVSEVKYHSIDFFSTVFNVEEDYLKETILNDVGKVLEGELSRDGKVVSYVSKLFGKTTVHLSLDVVNTLETSSQITDSDERNKFSSKMGGLFDDVKAFEVLSPKIEEDIEYPAVGIHPSLESRTKFFATGYIEKTIQEIKDNFDVSLANVPFVDINYSNKVAEYLVVNVKEIQETDEEETPTLPGVSTSDEDSSYFSFEVPAWALILLAVSNVKNMTIELYDKTGKKTSISYETIKEKNLNLIDELEIDVSYFADAKLVILCPYYQFYTEEDDKNMISIENYEKAIVYVEKQD